MLGEFIVLLVCSLDTSQVPPVFRLSDVAPLYVRRDAISGWREETEYGGERCVKILLGNQTVFVKGSGEELRRKLQRREQR